MKQFLKKGLLLATAALSIGSQAKADKGMWLLNELTRENLAQMKELGFRLPIDSLYSLDKPSIANSVVIFGRGCTGVTVSSQGLIFTNHHCGFDAIQSQSAVDHDYLRDGFVSQSFSEELPIEGLTVSYLSSIRDVTKEILAKLKKPKNEIDRLSQIQKICQALEVAEGKRLKSEHKRIQVRPYYANNKYYLITYDVFSDVRLVFAPPGSVGKFGGDTDNWMWPRHTGDFSVFRVYAGKDNAPANYSKDNVPYTPKYHATVSTEGYEKNDYAMTIGFPGSTSRYIPSFAVENRMKDQNEPRIEVRGIKQDIWRAAMNADQATRIKYASKYARSSNYWKNSIGMNKALVKLGVLDQKRAEETSFEGWVAASGKKAQAYKGILSEMEGAYKQLGTIERQSMYLREALIGGTEIVLLARGLGKLTSLPKEQVAQYLNDHYKDYLPALDQKVLPAMLDIVRQRVEASRIAPIFDVIDKEYGGDTKAYADALFANSVVPYKDKLLAILQQPNAMELLSKDPAVLLSDKVWEIYTAISLELKPLYEPIDRGNRLYFAGRRLQNPAKPMPSDANSTMRMSYGTIKGYSPADAVEYDYFTTSRGILEKNDPASTEFNVFPSFLELVKKGDWGRWADKKDGKLHVAFISTNDITGGNSGSPVFDKNGRVFGLAFDGNWEAMSGDIEFEPNLQRTIIVDIRYVLFTIDKWGKCSRLIDEMTIK
ncbi:S46 family peptidase [Porphyromonas sp.]